MNDLNEKMQERLDKWRKNILRVPSAEKIKGKAPVRFAGRKDYGDADDEEHWGQEATKSQSRR